LTSTRPPSLCLIGAGRVGTSLLRAAQRAGLDARLAGRDDAVAAARDAEAVLLSVPDSEIATACDEVSAGARPRYVGHTSGGTRLDALGSAADRDAETFSMHPLQTFPDDGTEIHGFPCAVAGSTPEAAAMARDLAGRLGMRPFDVPEESRYAYHAAASVASNLLIALEETAVEILARSGIEDGRELLAPLVLRTAANWADRGPRALTGPIVRGDEETVERHRDSLGEIDPALTELYDALAERCRAVAAGEGTAA
jgi:predicted short-subunit dehydrogenase-like oxidoreductase (DUF2520 family)